MTAHYQHTAAAHSKSRRSNIPNTHLRYMWLRVVHFFKKKDTAAAAVKTVKGIPLQTYFKAYVP